MVEGAPLLREYGVYSLIEGSNPSLSAKYEVPINRPRCRFFFARRSGGFEASINECVGRRRRNAATNRAERAGPKGEGGSPSNPSLSAKYEVLINRPRCRFFFARRSGIRSLD